MMLLVISRLSKGKWHPDSMKQAVGNVLTGQLSIRKAAEIYNIPKSTLIDRVSAVKRGKEITFTPALGRFKPTFNAEFEGVLLNHVKDLSDRLLPLTRKEFLNLAFQLAEALNIPNQFNRDKKTAERQLKKMTKKETTCIFCGESHDEDWVQCSSCQMWAHEDCANIPETFDTYECDFCQKLTPDCFTTNFIDHFIIMAPRKDWTSSRAVTLREEGYTFKEIARKLGNCATVYGVQKI
ncbi:hypothetical protein ANN_04055 [Periplaneta americana]|uniref:Zinc finger PHD-type domain-containing protein n=1 Tax=Periplaneta americana TaxID=6978 RepID=A0ABQ8T7I4_PERAM|nr:hypothetical protein ANN_04055 [Periplaneta americana]